MAKLRHIAMVVENMEKTAQFYEKAFEMKRVRQSDTAIGLSDGVVSLVIIHPSNINMKDDDRRGLHHLGFLVEDVDKESDRVMSAGAKLHGAIIDSMGSTEGSNEGSNEGSTAGHTEREHKFKDPNGQIFDLTTPGYARDVWQIKV